MPDPITFTPEEEARYARWGLGVQSDGEPAVTTPSTTQEVPAVQDPPADAGTDEDVLDEGDEGHEGGEVDGWGGSRNFIHGRPFLAPSSH